MSLNLPGLSVGTMDGRPVPPARHQRATAAVSRHHQRLTETQKLRAYYGVTERQLRAFAAMAMRSQISTGTALVQLLERRLDNVVVRAGFGRTIPAARQLIRRGHVVVNGWFQDNPSLGLEPSDVVAVRPRAREVVQRQCGEETPVCPEWLAVDHAALTALVVALPDETELPLPIELDLVVEFYS